MSRRVRSIIDVARADTAPSSNGIPGLDGLSEDALALAFTHRHRDELLYVHEWSQWLRWDGTRWVNERTLAVFDLARALTRAVGETIADQKIASRIRDAGTVAAIVTLARADRAHARVPEDFDTNPWLLNTPAGTVDLQTGQVHPHRRADSLTKVTPIAPADDASEAVLWQACLETWTGGDHDQIAYLQRLAGYWATGSVREETLTVLYGPGGNGKTKFVEAIRHCLGHEYAVSMAMESLVVTKNEQHPTDLADLRGARLAIASETEQGRRLAESKVKDLTGGGRLKARRMRRDFFEFDPTHKLVIFGNHRPGLRNVDAAWRRRIHLVPFTAVIPEAERDKDLAAKLDAERPAILRWILDGTLAWLRQGLAPPDRVLAATKDYLESADAFMHWVEERTVRDVNATTTKAAAFADWKAWAEAAGEFVGDQRRLTEQMSRLEWIDEARVGRNRARSWIGVGLRPRND